MKNDYHAESGSEVDVCVTLCSKMVYVTKFAGLEKPVDV